MDIKKINKMMQNGTLMSDYNIAHDKKSDRLYYPGAFQPFGDVRFAVMKQRLSDRKTPGILTSETAIQNEIDSYVNNHPKAQQIKEDIEFNKNRKKARDYKALTLVPALGGAIGAATPMVAAGAMDAILNSQKGNRLGTAIKGAKTMIDNKKPGAVKYKIPIMGAGIGIAASSLLAKKLNEKYRDSKVGKKRTDTLNDISYDLDNHMREQDTIKRIADNSTFKAIGEYAKNNMMKRASDIVDDTLEKEAGYKRDLRIARAEAKAKNPRLMFEYANPDEYRKTMEAYADGLESFLNSKERHQDWATKKDLANLSIANGESSKDIYDSGSSVKEFVNKRIKDKHLKDKSVPYTETSKPNSFLENSPDISNRSAFRPAVSPTSSSSFNKPTTPQERLKDIRDMVGDGKLTKEQLKDHTSRREIRRNITLKDSNLSKQLMSGKHKAEMLTMDQLKGDGIYFKTHSGENPFNIAGSAGRYIKRDFTGNPKMPKKGIPIWASKLPEVSTTYGDTVLAFKPNEAMIAGASPIDHRHLAKDTRHMTEKQIKLTNGWNQSFDLNRNPEYERVFTYDKKNMDKSTVATYKKHKIAPGGRFDHDAYVFTKNKPGSLADAYARKVVNGPQKAYGLSAKETKRLDRKAMLRYYDSIKDIENPTPFELSSQKDIHNTLTNINKARKDTAFRNNMAKALGAGALAGLAGYSAYKGIKKIKDKRDYIKSRGEQEMANNEKKANEVHYELQIEKQALK